METTIAAWASRSRKRIVSLDYDEMGYILSLKRNDCLIGFSYKSASVFPNHESAIAWAVKLIQERIEVKMFRFI